jgi:hypothetical protein
MHTFYDLPIVEISKNTINSTYYSPFVLVTYEDGTKAVGRFKSDPIALEDDEYKHLLGCTFNQFLNEATNIGIGFDGVSDSSEHLNTCPFDDVEHIELIESSLNTQIKKDNSQPARAILNYLINTSENINLDKTEYWELIKNSAEFQLNLHQETGSFNP